MAGDIGKRVEQARLMMRPVQMRPAGNGDCSDHSPFDDIPYDFNRDDYGAMMVEGDSMYPFLEPSDIVIFRDWKTERLSHIFAAEISDNQWVVKQLAYKDGRFVLRSLNDKYPDYEGPFRLAGYLVGIIRDRGNERLIRMNPQGLLPD